MPVVSMELNDMLLGINGKTVLRELGSVCDTPQLSEQKF